MMAAARRSGSTILPVDSEHNAIFQCLAGGRVDQVRRITLTASGGPFRTLGAEAMAHVTPAQAVAHTNWSMGAKISVDSATMMNKGLELIEAHHLFPVGLDRIGILVHQIGRASCRERVCQSVEISVVAVILKKKKT